MRGPWSRRLGMVAAGLLVGASAAGCREASRDEGFVAPRAELDEAEGTVRFRGDRIDVGTFVAHRAKMDLRVQCRLRSEHAQEAGRDEVPLCFDPDERRRFDTLRIEHRSGMRSGEALQRLRTDAGGAHFLVSPSGTRYQLLDLGHAPRRAGQLRPDEVRVLSGDAEGHRALRDALRERFPDLEVRTTRLDASDGGGDQPPEPTTGGGGGGPAPTTEE